MAIISYDTNALINLKDKAFKEHFLISSVVLEEIENIKSSRNKDEATKFNARRVADLLDEQEDCYDVIFYTKDISDFIMDTSNFATITNDTIICGSTAWYAKQNNIDVTFVTDDSICKSIAIKIFGLNTVSIHENNKDDYTGFVVKDVDEQTMADFYQDLNANRFNLLPNQYLVIKSDGKVVDALKWTGETHQNLKYSNIKSDYFGAVKPYQKDIYQAMALDSLLSNQVTMIRGFAGTGKSYLSIGTMFALLEKHKIDKIIVFCNTVATANSAKLGFYPGTREEKLIDSSIGNMLSAKLGGMYALDQLIDQEKIELLPMSDIRGFDTTNMKAAVYITEAQNLDISLMKLALQRIGEDSICIIDGDNFTQTDLPIYAGSNNGMRRMSQVFRGQNFYGEIELQNIYRSKIAQIAELM